MTISWLRQVADCARLLVGVPSYQCYADHVRSHHPEIEPMTPEAFFKERQEARYGGKGRVGRCC